MNKFIRASDFNNVFGVEDDPIIYTPYGTVNLFQPFEWQDGFIRQPKMFTLGVISGDDNTRTGHNLAFADLDNTLVLKKNHFVSNGGNKAINGSGFILEAAGSVISYTGNPSFQNDTPANYLSVPNFVSADTNAVITASQPRFHGFDILNVVLYNGDIDHSITIQDLAQERADQYLANLNKFDRIRYRFCFGPDVNVGIVTFYTTLFGELPGVTIVPFFLSDVNDESTCQSEIYDYVVAESELFFADQL